MPKLTVKGAASNKILMHGHTAPSQELSLMDYLRSQSINIASSCYGEGVCKKCIITLNDSSVLSCQVMLNDINDDINEIKIGYL